ncbi:uncharacterized protein LOC103494987 [Cucumis melo]|uniref:Uncharacterized protein LOC103494987 n=1 Tax=Cucumis melo TaxID=3656 RepID=A0A1S3BZ57_CUCME|nr:uncharacterized protein LOC103494987 [Cucumis melo]
MATPLQQQTSNTSHPPKPRAGRKPGPKNPNQKKPPQRGLGVAQLERLRLQENWKTVTEISPPTFLLHNTLPNFPLHFPPAPPPILHTDCIAAGAGAVLGFDHHGFVVQRIGNNGGFLPAGGVLIGNTSVEASRELSSIPKLPLACDSDRCDHCFKKKRVNFSNRRKEKNIIAAAAETPSFDFLGLGTNSTAELNTHSVMNHHTDSGWDLDYDFSLNLKQVRGGGGDGGEGSKLMEYEFFPRKNGRGTEIEELKMPKEELSLFREENEEEEEEVLAMDHGEGSCITTSCNDIINGGTRNSTALDLSLKLSF